MFTLIIYDRIKIIQNNGIIEIPCIKTRNYGNSVFDSVF